MRLLLQLRGPLRRNVKIRKDLTSVWCIPINSLTSEAEIKWLDDAGMIHNARRPANNFPSSIRMCFVMRIGVISLFI